MRESWCSSVIWRQILCRSTVSGSVFGWGRHCHHLGERSSENPSDPPGRLSVYPNRILIAVAEIARGGSRDAATDSKPSTAVDDSNFYWNHLQPSMAGYLSPR
eukprot:Gb_09073 [translate_table: standard]